MTVGVERPKRQPVTGQHRVVRIHPDDNVAVAVDARRVAAHTPKDTDCQALARKALALAACRIEAAAVQRGCW